MPNLLLGVLRPAIVAAGGVGYMTQGNLEDGVFRWALPADTVTTITSTPDVTDGTAAMQNTGVAGYVTQGFDGLAESDALYKLAIPAETWSSTTSLPDTVFSGDGWANDEVAGYVNVGIDGDLNDSDVVYKITFPTDSVTTSTSLPAAASENAATQNRDVAGYISSGIVTSPSASNLFKWAFPGDTVSTVGGMFGDSAEGAAEADPANYAVFTEIGTEATKVTIPTDSRSAYTTFPVDFYNNAAFADPGVALYFSVGGEFDPFDPIPSDAIYKTPISTEAWSVTTSAPLDMGFHSGFSSV